MATAVEDKTANDIKEPDTTNLTENGDQVKDEAEVKNTEDVKTKTNDEDIKNEPVTEATNGDDVKDQDSKGSKRKFDDESPRGYKKGRDYDDYDNKRGRYNDRGNKRGRGFKKVSQRKTNYENLKESNDADEIRRQVEFYFSDSNLPTDRYLFGLTQGTENFPVPLKKICDFGRMRHFQPYSAIRDALKDSEWLNIDENDGITRKIPLGEKYSDNLDDNFDVVNDKSNPRSIYAKGFGEETSTSQMDIENFFAPYGPTKSIRLRRMNDQYFKGSVFVEFEDEEMAKTFLELDPKPQWNGKDLQIMSKQAYVDMKNEAIKDGTVRPRSPNASSFGGRGRGSGGRGRGRGNFSRGTPWKNRDKGGYRDRKGIDNDNWKERRARDQEDDRKRRGGKRDRRSRSRSSSDRSDYSRDDRSRSRSPFREDNKRKRSRDERDDEDAPERDQAEVKKTKVDEDAVAGGEAEKANGDAAEVKEQAVEA